MAVLFSSPLASLSSSSPSMPLAFTANLVSRLSLKPMASHTKSFNGLCFQITSIVTGRHAMIIKASSSENELTDSNGGIPNSESDDEESLPLDKLPLESKLQLKLEQKMRMKMAKKIRLRRKKLVRKRRMRKKGRWPPSKMKKSKNV
ncbi:50S ribosomal protein 5, chloroplastic-like [Carica papaya]|uniref:50S ribosomal protein 5, chloroplastic-like n=1 Tax=Carica papaya TaxID=3649 RepID=UPI000B8D0FD2|nr:50S ribosomal protein 5, chloroplastic-like [Carica papaya]XP_021901229.1 50S ribosomal protein 5, chloroplastic-like [Carica papaya]